MMPSRLLILDDDPVIGLLMQQIAECLGMVVRVTQDSATFFQLAEQWRPDIIVLDLIMPGMDGVQVMGGLESRQCTSRIILSSSVGNRVLEAAGRSAAEHGLNMTGVLPKPFSPLEFRTLLTSEFMDSHAPAGCRSKEGNPTPQPTLDDLRQALDNHDIHVVFQPKVSCRTGDVAGFEALARWSHPQLGMVSPERFIALAESGGYINRLTEQVLDQALGWFGKVRHASGPLSDTMLAPSCLDQLTLSVNISALSLRHASFLEWVIRRVQEKGLPTDRLIFELTESSAMEGSVTELDMLTRLRMKGFHLSIDDFGTGFSSLSQLARLPFSEVKVDKSFVMSAMTSRESCAVIESIIALGHSLGLQVTAEGIEDAATLLYLRDLGCDLLQGYYLARPMTAEQTIDWLRQYDVDQVLRPET